jgi:hypothetical protein
MLPTTSCGRSPREPGSSRHTRGVSHVNPAGSVPVLGDFDDDFFRACALHDFGYRNYGHGLALSPNEDTRGWIDDRLLQETRRICNNEVPFLDRLICHGVASAFWTAVRNFGRDSFYNG